MNEYRVRPDALETPQKLNWWREFGIGRAID
jgi:hypothetical protein